MNINDLFENNRAHLFHATGIGKVIQILADNTIIDKTSHGNNKIPERGNHNNIHLTSIFGVSLTRSFLFASKWKRMSAIFELDTNKLIQNYRIIPIDYYEKSCRSRDEAEEFLIGPLKNLNKYLTFYRKKSVLL